MIDVITVDKSDILRHRLIKNICSIDGDDIADTAIILWDQMASKIISIIGENGFKSLYVRSVQINISKFSWLSSYNPKSESNNQFNGLRLCFKRQSSNQILAVNYELLITLTDILASLIGEQITTKILSMAWGDVASEIISKELNNE
jgi:hypothetical protein